MESVTFSEAARRLGLDRRDVTTLIDEHEIAVGPCTSNGNGKTIAADDLDRLRPAAASIRRRRGKPALV